MPRKKISIACQGGGSQTAFTAGVLKALFENKAHEKYEIVGLSGTSGGAVCAALSWYGLLKAANGDTTPIHDRLCEFWSELTVQHPQEWWLDRTGSSFLRNVAQGLIPQYELSPSSVPVQAMFGFLNMFLPRPIFTDLRAMLTKHIDFSEAQRLSKSESPVLIVGAADVLTGELKKFYSHRQEICVEAILASAAVPMLFPAVEIGGHYYWDGLFSDNPPIVELIRPRYVGAERIPDEVWVIQINPTKCGSVPTAPAEIMDRRNQMIGNVSFHHSLEILGFINVLFSEKGFSEECLQKAGVTRREPIQVRIISMSEELLGNLDYVSKLSRDPELIGSLLKDGEKQGSEFYKGVESAGLKS